MGHPDRIGKIYKTLRQLGCESGSCDNGRYYNSIGKEDGAKAADSFFERRYLNERIAQSHRTDA